MIRVLPKPVLGITCIISLKMWISSLLSVSSSGFLRAIRAKAEACPFQHPVKLFVPKNVHENLPVLYMAPSTEYVPFLCRLVTPLLRCFPFD